jgi:predicted nucleotidyltransferase
LDLGPGLDGRLLAASIQRLCDLEGVQAVLAFGSRARGDARPDSDLDLAVIVEEPTLTPHDKLKWWTQCQQAIGSLGIGVDLVIQGRADAERLSQSRWHVMGDVAREGRVLLAAG